MIVAKFVIGFLLVALFFAKLPWLYDKFTKTTDDQMDAVAKTNKESKKRANKRKK